MALNFFIALMHLMMLYAFMCNSGWSMAVIPKLVRGFISEYCGRGIIFGKKPPSDYDRIHYREQTPFSLVSLRDNSIISPLP